MKRQKLDRTIWSPHTAYAIGLLVADGSLSKDGRHLDFTSKDKDLIVHFQNCLNLHHCKIGTKSSGTTPKRTYYRVQFSDKHFYDWLQTIGIHPNKSLTIGEVTLPDELFFDFLRGVFDGDGTIYKYEDRRWQNSTTIALGFASGSEAFLLWLHTQLQVRLGVTGFVTKGARVLQLRFGKRDALLITQAMYNDLTLPHLARKFAKVRKILRISSPQ
jgi:DNA-binding transcriptional regulator WhiA